MTKTLAQMTDEIRALNTDKGWRTDSNTHGDYVAILHSEITEALEAYRDHRLDDATRPTCGRAAGTGEACPEHGPSKPEGVGSEFADVLIRVLDMCDVFGLAMPESWDTLADVTPGALPAHAETFGDHIAYLHLRAALMTRFVKDGFYAAGMLAVLVAVCNLYGVDLTAEYERKMTYGWTRPYQHGGRTLSGLRPAAGGRP